jgi:hypothetical protein
MSSNAPVTITRTLTQTTMDLTTGRARSSSPLRLVIAILPGQETPCQSDEASKDSTDHKNETNGLFVVTRHYEKRSGDLRARGASFALLPRRIVAKAIDVPKSSDSVL